MSNNILLNKKVKVNNYDQYNLENKNLQLRTKRNIPNKHKKLETNSVSEKSKSKSKSKPKNELKTKKETKKNHRREKTLNEPKQIKLIANQINYIYLFTTNKGNKCLFIESREKSDENKTIFHNYHIPNNQNLYFNEFILSTLSDASDKFSKYLPIYSEVNSYMNSNLFPLNLLWKHSKYAKTWPRSIEYGLEELKDYLTQNLEISFDNNIIPENISDPSNAVNLASLNNNNNIDSIDNIKNSVSFNLININKEINNNNKMEALNDNETKFLVVDLETNQQSVVSASELKDYFGNAKVNISPIEPEKKHIHLNLPFEQFKEEVVDTHRSINPLDSFYSSSLKYYSNKPNFMNGNAWNLSKISRERLTVKINELLDEWTTHYSILYLARRKTSSYALSEDPIYAPIYFYKYDIEKVVNKKFREVENSLRLVEMKEIIQRDLKLAVIANISPSIELFKEQLREIEMFENLLTKYPEVENFELWNTLLDHFAALMIQDSISNRVIEIAKKNKIESKINNYLIVQQLELKKQSLKQSLQLAIMEYNQNMFFTQNPSSKLISLIYDISHNTIYKSLDTLIYFLNESQNWEDWDFIIICEIQYIYACIEYLNDLTSMMNTEILQISFKDILSQIDIDKLDNNSIITAELVELNKHLINSLIDRFPCLLEQDNVSYSTLKTELTSLINNYSLISQSTSLSLDKRKYYPIQSELNFNISKLNNSISQNININPSINQNNINNNNINNNMDEEIKEDDLFLRKSNSNSNRSGSDSDKKKEKDNNNDFILKEIELLPSCNNIYNTYVDYLKLIIREKEKSLTNLQAILYNKSEQISALCLLCGSYHSNNKYANNKHSYTTKSACVCETLLKKEKCWKQQMKCMSFYNTLLKDIEDTNSAILQSITGNDMETLESKVVSFLFLILFRFSDPEENRALNHTINYINDTLINNHGKNAILNPLRIAILLLINFLSGSKYQKDLYESKDVRYKEQGYSQSDIERNMFISELIIEHVLIYYSNKLKFLDLIKSQIEKEKYIGSSRHNKIIKILKDRLNKNKGKRKQDDDNRSVSIKSAKSFK